MNRRGASLIICLSLVINSLVLNIPKSSFESLNNESTVFLKSITDCGGKALDQSIGSAHLLHVKCRVPTFQSIDFISPHFLQINI